MAIVAGTFSGRSQYRLVLVVNQGQQEIANNRTMVGIQVYIEETTEWGSWSNYPLYWSVNVAGYTWSGQTTYNFNQYNSLMLLDTAVWVGHNADGSKSIDFSAAASGDTPLGNANTSGALSLSTIPRTSEPSLSSSSFNAGATITVNTNRAHTSFYHIVKYSFGNSSGLISNGVADSVNWTAPLELMNQIPNAVSGTGVITVDTYASNGTAYIGSRQRTFTLNVPGSIVPSLTNITIAEAVAAVNTQVGKFVQNQSRLSLGIEGEVGAYGSSISAYKLEVLAGTTVRQTFASKTATTSPIIDGGTAGIIRATVTDTRGRTATLEKGFSVLNWKPPALNSISSQRALSNGNANDEGTYIRVNLNVAVSTLMNGTTQKNSLRYKISTRTKGTTAWTQKVDTTATHPIISLNTSIIVTGPYAITSSFEVLIEVMDIFSGSTVTQVITVAKVFMHWNGSAGVGIGKYHENGALDVAGTIYSSGTVVDPIGILAPYAGSVVPSGWLICDGRVLLRAQYPALFAAIGLLHSSGLAPTEFAIPDLRGRVITGIDSSQVEFSSFGAKGGAKTHTLVTAEIPSHSHRTGISSSSAMAATSGGASAMVSFTQNQAPTEATGGGGAHNNLQPYINLNWIIRAI